VVRRRLSVQLQAAPPTYTHEVLREVQRRVDLIECINRGIMRAETSGHEVSDLPHCPIGAPLLAPGMRQDTFAAILFLKVWDRFRVASCSINVLGAGQRRAGEAPLSTAAEFNF
jgi:hypothetical protein